MIRRIKACLNGGRPSPATPDDLAVAAAGAVAAGAEALHLHPRDAAGRESLAAGDIAAAVTAVRAACPGVPIGVSTGLWMTGGDPRRRAELVRGWTVRPDFASVNAGEPGFAELAALLTTAGIGVEAGVWRPAEVDTALGSPLDRVLIEIIATPAVQAATPAAQAATPAAGASATANRTVATGDPALATANRAVATGETAVAAGDRAVAAADAILARLDAAGYRGERLLHGEEETCWPLIAHAGRLGLPTRIGLEDTLTRPDGTPAQDNADLVRHALTLWSTPPAR